MHDQRRRVVDRRLDVAVLGAIPGRVTLLRPSKVEQTPERAMDPLRLGAHAFDEIALLCLAEVALELQDGTAAINTKPSPSAY